MADYLNTEYLKDLFAKMNMATSAPAKKEEALVTVPMVSTPAQKSFDQTGLVVEKSNKPVSTNTEVQAKATTATPPKSGPSFDTQAQKWFGLTNEKWNALSAEEKQNKSDIALKGMIESYNANQKKLGTGKSMTVAEQYALYISRCSSKAEVARLTQTVKSMDKDNQLEAFKSSYKYQDESFRDVAEGILAVDYTKLHEDNVVAAAKETENFSEKNQIIAAQNASKVKVEIQEAVVEAFMGRTEKVDMALSGQVGKFGVNADGTVNNKIQLNCFEKISTSKFQSVVENTAANIYQLVSENQTPATQIIINTDNEGAIKAAASQIYKCSQENQVAIKSALINTKYESVKQEVANQEAIAKKEAAAKAEEAEKVQAEEAKAQAEKEQAAAPQVDNNSMEAKINSIKDKIEGKQDVSKEVQNLSDIEKIKLLRDCPDLMDVIAQGNASLQVLDAIGQMVRRGGPSQKISYEKLPIKFMDQITQSNILDEMKSQGTLDKVDSNDLKSSAKKYYFTLINRK